VEDDKHFCHVESTAEVIGLLDGSASLAGEFIPMVTGVPIHAGDLFRIVAPNGGGFGDPVRREPWRVREDVLDGFATVDQARELYRVVLRGEALEIDAEATAELRRPAEVLR
jgi:N-methylhydantoinase B/oxoprolinase/acetone carboxylase alpha subunit